MTCRYLGKNKLTDDNKKQIRSSYPGFVFNELAKFVHQARPTTVDSWGYNYVTFPYNILYGRIPLLNMNFFRLKISSNDYSDWLNTSYNIVFQSDAKKIPKPLTICEALLDKNVLPIKKIVNDIGDLNKLIEKERKNFFLYGYSNIISNTFFIELNKKIQSCGLISLRYSED